MLNRQRSHHTTTSGRAAHKRGYLVEKIVRVYLRLKGYKILEQNYRTEVGEIDIIAQRRGIIAFIEVKFRQTQHDALHAVPIKTQRRICRAAEHYIAHAHRYTQRNADKFTLRFDFIAVAPPYYIKHIPNAWIL